MTISHSFIVWYHHSEKAHCKDSYTAALWDTQNTGLSAFSSWHAQKHNVLLPRSGLRLQYKSSQVQNKMLELPQSLLAARGAVGWVRLSHTLTEIYNTTQWHRHLCVVLFGPLFWNLPPWQHMYSDSLLEENNMTNLKIVEWAWESRTDSTNTWFCLSKAPEVYVSFIIDYSYQPPALKALLVSFLDKTEI